MKRACFLTLSFQRYDENAPSLTRYIRIRASEIILYADCDSFSDISLLNDLRDGDIIHVGALMMSNGNYSLCWLHCPGKGTLKPGIYDYPKQFVSQQKPSELTTKLWIVFSVFCVVIGVYYWPFLFAVIPIFSVGRFVFYRLKRAMAKDDALTQELKQGFDSVIDGDFSRFNIQKDTYSTNNKRGIETVEDKSLALYQGQVSNVFHYYYKRQRYSPNHVSMPNYFIRTTFTLQNKIFHITYLTSNLDNASLSTPDFYDEPLMFLSEGDKISLIYQLDRDTVLGLFNEEDGGAYGKGAGRSMLRSEVRIIGFVSVFIMMVIIEMFVLSDVLEWWRGNIYPGWREWSDLLNTLGLLALSMVGALVLAGIAIKITTFFRLRFSKKLRCINAARKILRAYRRNRGRSETIQDFF